MFESLKRWWKYAGAKLNATFEEKADPAVQLEQAIREAQTQHQRLKQQAAAVIANQKQAQLRLNAKMGELEQLTANARQALVMSNDARTSGDLVKAGQFDEAAETIAGRLLQLEDDIEDLKAMVIEATGAADQAKRAVEQNARSLQSMLSERAKLMSQLDQAKMQEELNTAVAGLGEAVGQDVPTLEEVRQKIELRYAKAKGMAELEDTTVDSRIREIEVAASNIEAQKRLDTFRAELGLPQHSPPAALQPPTDEPVGDETA